MCIHAGASLIVNNANKIDCDSKEYKLSWLTQCCVIKDEKAEKYKDDSKYLLMADGF